MLAPIVPIVRTSSLRLILHCKPKKKCCKNRKNMKQYENPTLVVSVLLKQFMKNNTLYESVGQFSMSFENL